MQSIFYNDWQSLVRTLVVGVLAYGVLVFVLRVSGKRTLSKMNAFDFIVTVALGSTLATILLSKDVALAEGALALALLVSLQLIVTLLSVRSKAVSRLVKAQPALLVHRGEFFEGALRRERVTREEVLAAVRQAGQASLAEVSVIMETDGTLSVIGEAPADPQQSAMQAVHVPRERRRTA